MSTQPSFTMTKAALLPAIVLALFSWGCAMEGLPGLSDAESGRDAMPQNVVDGAYFDGTADDLGSGLYGCDDPIRKGTPPWPMFQRCRGRQGRANVAVVVAPRLAWNMAVSALQSSSPVIAADSTTIAITKDQVLGLNAADGALAWSYNGCALGAPAIGSDGTIFAVPCDAILVALDPGGRLKWRFGEGSNGTCPLLIGPANI